ncbi:MAG: glycerate kinase [Clostridia bacterium]|nr:glycerate kinase [Clostridia bacterium]
MRFLFASDSYKGSLSSQTVNQILADAAKQIFPDCVCDQVAIADGGEGTLEAFLSQKTGRRIEISVHDPLFRIRPASYAVSGDTAVICMAEASGLPLLSENERNPLWTTTYGTGELILHALQNGYKNIAIGIGGSATNDGGIGAMIALGAQFLDVNGNPLRGIGNDLQSVARIDLSKLSPLIQKAKFTIMCDVTNPLLGETGATYTYGPQKGATAEILPLLEAGMTNYAQHLNEVFQTDVQTVRGGGAAGGLGAALKLFLNGEMQSGIDVLLDIAGFDELVAKADFVFSGEGRIDWQSANGKVLSGLGKRCQRAGKPLICIAGSLGKNFEEIYQQGVTAAFSILNKPMSLQEAIDNSEKLLHATAESIFRILKTNV